MTWKRLETMREVRLWLTQLVIPIAAIGAAVMNIPEVREKVFTKVNDVKAKIKTRLDEK